MGDISVIPVISRSQYLFAPYFQGSALTLNNQHLWHYHTINQLSRYGNPDWKIYASSPINWQTNVMKCLSKIKWYTVPEDFPFRIGPNPNLSNETDSEENS